MSALKIQKIGDEVSVVLDADTLELLEAGHVLTLHKQDDQVIVARQTDETARQTELARGILKRYRKTFEALAK